MVFAAFGAGVLLWLNSEHGTFRFAPVNLGPFSLFAAIAFTWIGAILTLRLRARWARVAGHVGITVFGILTFLALPGLMFVSALGFGGTELLQKVPMSGYDVTLYRHSCGVLCDTGLWLKQEWPVVPGVVRVRMVRRWSNAAEGSVERVAWNRVHVTVQQYDRARGHTVSDMQVELDPRMFAFGMARRPHN